MYKPNDSNSYPKSKSNVRACVQLQLTDTRARTKNLYTYKVAIRQFNTRGTASCASLFKSPIQIRLTHKLLIYHCSFPGIKSHYNVIRAVNRAFRATYNGVEKCSKE